MATKTLDVAHFSMQFSDTEREVYADAKRVFGRGYDWITGTEAGQAPVLPELRDAALRGDYAFTAYKSNWVAVRKEHIMRNTFKRGGVTVVDNDETVGRGHDLNVCFASFIMPRVGELSIFASHYATKGTFERGRDVNLKHNRTLAQAIGELADEAAIGTALAFYGGDQNIVDAKYDTFFGESLTSAWDELKKYENTGHGNIDVIASHDKDGRVQAKYIRALDDKELWMNTDHFPVEAGFTVKLLDD